MACLLLCLCGYAFMKRKGFNVTLTVVISLGIVAFGVFRFPNSVLRLGESLRDLYTSIVNYFCWAFDIRSKIDPTVMNLPAWHFPSMGVGTTGLPFDFEGFKQSFDLFWKSFFDVKTFKAYNIRVGKVIFNGFKVIVLSLPFIVVLCILIARALNKPNVEHNVDTKPLQIYKRIKVKAIEPCVNAVREYIAFLHKYKQIVIVWAFAWALYFNFITIIVEIFAFYFYFVATFSIKTLYRQFYKLVIDLSVMFDFVPLPVFVILIIYGLNKWADNIGYNELRHRERKNRGFLNERGVSTVFTGKMGKGKTTLMTDLALSAQVELRERALEVLTKSYFRYPAFPWIVLEDELKIAFKKRKIWDKYSCEKWVEKKRARFCNKPSKEKIFGYDIEREPLTYDDGLTVKDIWSSIKSYAVCYLIYTRGSAYIVSNYSCRVDDIKEDIGNFPLYNTDFFDRKSYEIDDISRRSHILDYDMLRLGRKLQKNNPNAYAFGYGVYVISEIDKERKNTLELKGVKADADETNQKNDYFNNNVKMSRHVCTVENENFVLFFGDLQRPGSLGSDLTELGELINVAEREPMRPTLPFFSPFYFYECVYSALWAWYEPRFLNGRFSRGNNRLSDRFIRWLVSRMRHRYERKMNTFGSSKTTLDIDGKTAYYYLQSKKIYSDRFCTDCQSGIYERFAKYNHVGLDDLPTYGDSMASPEELDKQNSYFQNEVKTYGGLSIDD